MTDDLLLLPRKDLQAMARAILVRQARLIYAAEALPMVVRVFDKNMEVMSREQLTHIIRRGDLVP